jgi:predicted nucleic acid-binding protein
MNAKPFLDTNIVVYAFSSNDSRNVKAEALLEAGGIISVQVLNEFVSVSRRKQRRNWNEVNDAVGALKILLDPPQPLTLELHEAAVTIARDHGFSIYDGLIIAAALRAECAILYSEDFQHGLAIGPLTICNPFVD